MQPRSSDIKGPRIVNGGGIWKILLNYFFFFGGCWLCMVGLKSNGLSARQCIRKPAKRVCTLFSMRQFQNFIYIVTCSRRVLCDMMTMPAIQLLGCEGKVFRLYSRCVPLNLVKHIEWKS